MSRQCRHCASTISPSETATRCRNVCKTCHRKQIDNWQTANRERCNELARQWSARRRELYSQSHAYDDVMSETEGEATSILYLMRYEFDPCTTMGIKIGRTKNIARRVADIESGHNFRMKLLRAYKGMGNLEGRVHQLLASRRASGGPGTEWFDVSFAAAMKAVALARALGPGDDLQEAASALSESLDDEDSPPQ